MAEQVIQAGPEIGIRIDAMREDISRFSRTGEDLIVDLRNGDRILVRDFYTPAENNSLHSLILGDSTEAGVVGTLDDADSTFGQEEQIALAGLGAAGLGLALSGGDDGGDDDDGAPLPTDPTDGT
ncbi:BapA/Bap/LapF family prefix-like domain-containing protein, partial [Roseivivax isoporae]|uniref:BapA/Bap/LapF family prefix-like domain-containing protein n=1 Tax=Roseivivax isoporae TaxID=591206 RepID=UPI0005C1B04D